MSEKSKVKKKCRDEILEKRVVGTDAKPNGRHRPPPFSQSSPIDGLGFFWFIFYPTEWE
jgi:hypothetical protein